MLRFIELNQQVLVDKKVVTYLFIYIECQQLVDNKDSVVSF